MVKKRSNTENKSITNRDLDNNPFRLERAKNGTFQELNNNGFHKLKLAYAEGGVADQFLKPMFALIGAVNIDKWVETMTPKDQQEVFGMGYLEQMAHEADADKDGLLSLKEAKAMVMKVAAKAHKSG